MPELTLYHFGRLNLSATYIEAKREYVLKGLRSSKPLVSNNINWGFLEVGDTVIDEGEFVFGLLAKFRTLTQEEVVNPQLGAIVDVPVENMVVGKSVFFMHIDTGIIAFHPHGGQIDPELFRKRFVEVFINAHDGFFAAAEIEVIQEQYVFLEEIRRFSTIERVEIHLHPSNPSTSDVWEKIDKDLKLTQTGKYTEVREATKRFGKLNIVDNEDLKAKAGMATDGYGKVVVSGSANGKPKTLSTSDNPVTTEAPVVDDTNRPIDVLEQLRAAFRKVMDRVKHLKD